MPSMISDEITAWQARNPLRVWRTETGTKLGTIAYLLSVSLTSIQKWENGASRPSQVNMRGMARMMSRPIQAIEDDWHHWRTTAPAIV